MPSITAVIFTLASVTILAPIGWHETDRAEDRVNLQSSDNRQQATVSLMRFQKVLTFEHFKILCAKRVEAEKRVGPEIFLEPDSPLPFQTLDHFGLFYSGGEKQSHRVFSCYMRMTGNELVTVYVEGSGITPKEHLKTFEFYVQGLKQ